MTSTTTDEVLRQDRRGRVRVPRERREALLAEFATSGLSGAEFARLAGVKYATFANWVQQRRKAGGTSAAAQGAVRLVEAVVAEESPGIGRGTGLLLELPGGCRARVETPMQLAMAAELVKLIAHGSRGC
jgi:transposase-like protein